MTVTIATARHTAEFEGRTFYFCAAGCRERFLREPERYATTGSSGGMV
jgi:Cu+-exporting ATPase